MSRFSREVLVVAFLVAGFGPRGVGQTKPEERPLPPPSELSELQATKGDITRMRVVLNQMRTNLAFVTTTTNPLKHQFELDIDMWQALLDQMQRRVDAAERAKQGK